MKSETGRIAGVAGADGGNMVWGCEECVEGITEVRAVGVGAGAGMTAEVGTSGVDVVGCEILSQKVGSLGRGD